MRAPVRAVGEGGRRRMADRVARRLAGVGECIDASGDRTLPGSLYADTSESSASR